MSLPSSPEAGRLWEHPGAKAALPAEGSQTVLLLPDLPLRDAFLKWRTPSPDTLHRYIVQGMPSLAGEAQRPLKQPVSLCTSCHACGHNPPSPAHKADNAPQRWQSSQGSGMPFLGCRKPYAQRDGWATRGVCVGGQELGPRASEKAGGLSCWVHPFLPDNSGSKRPPRPPFELLSGSGGGVSWERGQLCTPLGQAGPGWGTGLLGVRPSLGPRSTGPLDPLPGPGARLRAGARVGRSAPRLRGARRAARGAWGERWRWLHVLG